MTDKVRSVQLYTRSDDPHNRQIVVRMRSRKTYRFSESEMGDTLRRFSLPTQLLDEIEDAAVERVNQFAPDDEAWIPDSTADEFAPADVEPPTVNPQKQADYDVAQRLLCEFQSEVQLLRS